MDSYWSNGVPPLFGDCTFETFRNARGTKDASGLCKGYAGNVFKGTDSGLYIHGPVGSGKTHLAIAILHYIAGRVDDFASGRARFIDVHTLVQFIRKPPDLRGADPLEFIMRAPFLVLDGVDGENGVEYVQTILRHRYSHRLPTVVTSTLAPGDKLEEALSSGVASRLFQMCDVAYLPAPDARKVPRKDFLFV